MMDTATIRDFQRQAAQRAARQNKVPYVPFDESDIDEKKLSIPNLGNYCPKGYKMIDDVMVDSSGFGSPGEPALTMGEFLDRMRNDLKEKKNLGYAIVEEGQFQVVVGVFEVVKAKAKVTPVAKVTKVKKSKKVTLRGGGEVIK